MVVNDLSEVFVASGVNDVDAKTFTALFYGYEVRGKVRIPSVPTIEFYFYGNVYTDAVELQSDFIANYEEKFGHAKFRFTDKFVSITLDIGSLDAAQVKERLGAVGMFMISNGFGAIALQPDEPEPEPEPIAPPEPKVAPKPKTQPRSQNVQQTQQPKRQVQQPVYQEPQAEFEEYKVLEKLTQIFLLGVNKVSNNTFTTVYHGFNVVGKMLHPQKEDIEIIFYGELMQNVTEEFEALKKELEEKYTNLPIRMIGGSCDAILRFEGKDVGQCKEMLGHISGFMMKNNIVAINLPNTIGDTIVTYTAESYKEMKSAGGGAYSSSASRTGSYASASSQPNSMRQSYNAPSTQSGYGSNQGVQGEENNFVGKFLKKFSKKP